MAQLHSINEHVAYLQHVFTRLWSAGHGLMGDRAITEIAKQVPDPFAPISQPVANLEKLPSVQRDGALLEIRAPARGLHHLEFGVAFGIGVTADFALAIPVSATGSKVDPTINIGVDIPTGLEVVGAMVGGVSVIVAKELLEEAAQAVVRTRASGSIDDWARTLSTLRYDRSVDFDPVPVPQIRENGGWADVRPEHCSDCDWIDIVLVADGYADAAEFLDQSDRIAAALTDPSRIDNARFRAVAGAIRMWRLPLVGAGAAERMSATTKPAGSSKQVGSLGNLARLAEAGIILEETIVGARGKVPTLRPIIVVVQHAAKSTRAIALGDVVVLPVEAGASAARDAGDVLVHELGHVVGELADEYEGSGAFYTGPEPLAINVSREPLTADFLPHKWEPWANTGPKAAPNDPEYQVRLGDAHVRGAYEFMAGVYRPAHGCKMRASTADVPFCPVCEEAVCDGLLDRAGAFDADARPPLALEVRYVSPWRGAPEVHTRPVPVGSSATIRLPAARVFEGSTADTTKIRLRCVASVIPDARVLVQIAPGAFEERSEIVVGLGTMARVRVVPGPDAPLSPGVAASLSQEFKLDFADELDPPLDPPTELDQRPGVGCRVRPTVTANGGIRFDLELSARHRSSGANAGQKTDVVFALERTGGGAPTYYRRPATDDGEVRRVHPGWIGAAGAYRWHAFTELRGTDMRSAPVELPAAPDGTHFAIGTVTAAPYGELPLPRKVVASADDAGSGSVLDVAPDLVVMSAGTPAGSRDVSVPVEAISRLDRIAVPDRRGSGRGAMPAAATVSVAARARASRGTRTLGSPVRRSAPMPVMPMPPRAGRGVRGRAALTGPPVDPRTFGAGHPYASALTTVAPDQPRRSLRVTAANFDDVRFIASAFHPLGRPVRFEFELRDIDAGFDGNHPIVAGPVSPGQPELSFIVFGEMSLGDNDVPYNLNRYHFKLRVRTTDEDGVTSHWYTVDDVRVSIA